MHYSNNRRVISADRCEDRNEINEGEKVGKTIEIKRTSDMPNTCMRVFVWVTLNPWPNHSLINKNTAIKLHVNCDTTRGQQLNCRENGNTSSQSGFIGALLQTWDVCMQFSKLNFGLKMMKKMVDCSCHDI